MANKNYTLDLSNLSTVDSATLKEGQEVAIKFGDSTVVSVKTSKPATNKVDLAGFGTIRTTDGKLVDFVADAGIAAGTYGVSVGATNPVSINSFDASKATNDLTVSIAAANFDGAKKVVTGSGKDTIYLGEGLVAFGGANADTFMADSTKASTISDYNYAEGDIVKLNTVLASSGFDWINDGATIKGGANGTTIKAADNDGAFKVLLEDSAKAKLLAAKAVTGAAAEITLDRIDGQVDVSAAKSAVVDLGAGSDAVTGAATTALTLKVGLKDGNNTISALDDDDTIRFSSGSWKNVSVSTNGKDLSFGTTKLNGVLGNKNVFNVQFGDGEVQKVAYTSDNSTNVAIYDKDVNFYLGKSSVSAGISVNAANEKVNLNLITGAKDVAEVTVTAAQALNLVAAGNSSITASATPHEDDFVFDLTASSETAVDSLALAANNSKDIVKLSTIGGKDTVTGFNVDDDVLVLTDVSTITDKTFDINGSDLYLDASLKGAQVAGAVNNSTNDGKDITVQLSDGTVEKVAMVVNTGAITATKDTTVVIQNNNATDLSLASKAAGQMFDMSNVDANNSVKFVGDAFENVTVGTENGAAMFIGTKGVNNITVASGASENGAALWAGKGNDATVTLSDGADIVWAGFLDGDVTVTNITKDDAIYTYDKNLDAKAVADKLSYNKNNALVFASSDTAELNVGNTDGFKVAGNAGSIYNVVAGGAGGATVEYSADADIFVGKDATLDVMVEKTAEIDLSGTMGFDSKIYKGIKNIDASASTSNSCLVLANSAGGQITASAGGSAMWGGGSEYQTLIGGAGADIFWFGRADGADTARNVGKEDYVFLYNATDISEVEINNNKLVFTNTGSTLTFTNSVAVTEMTFSINDSANSGGFKNYSYDATSKTFVEKN